MSSRDSRADSVDEAVAQSAHVLALDGNVLVSAFQGGPQADDARHVLGGGAAAALLRTSMLLWDNGCVLPDIEDAHAFRPVELVRRHR